MGFYDTPALVGDLWTEFEDLLPGLSVGQVQRANELYQTEGEDGARNYLNMLVKHPDYGDYEPTIDEVQ